MPTAKRLELPELFPQPKFITATEGNSDLAADIRLVTNNVLPLQRKAIRSVLTTAGVKVVANKKRYVVSATVTTPEDYDLSDVPEFVQHDYYELTIKGSEVAIRTPYQEGTVWAAQTLACIFRRFFRKGEIPNLFVRDWPSFPYRGIFVENKWGPDRMTMVDWCQTIDTVASLKMNLLGIGLYGCWGNCRFEGGDKPTEFLMVPVKGHDTLSNTHSLRWYSPAKDMWKEETYKAFLSENDMLVEVVNYAHERGITIVPFVNSLGHNTLIPRLLPNLSAKDADGNPTGVGYCLSNPELRTFMTEFYGGILDRYFSTGCDIFHVQLDEVWPDHPSPEDPVKVGSPWCECPACKARKQEDMLKQHILWLVKMLTDKGVGKVFIWNDQLTRHMDALDDQFAKDLEAAGIRDRVILDWWGYSNTEIREKTHVKLGKVLGLDGVVSPMTCYYNWSTYSYNLPNIDLMMKMAHEEGAYGTISYSVHDPSHLDHEALMAAYAWEPLGNESFNDTVKRWATIHFQDKTDSYLEAVELIRNAVANPVYAACLNYQYTYVGNVWPRSYPGEALDKIQAMPPETKPVETLNALADNAEKAAGLLSAMLENDKLDELERDCLKSLLGDALRIQYNAKAFAWLVDLRLALEPGMVKKSQATACQKLHDELVPLLAQMEKSFPSWLVPSVLHALSPLLEFLEQLAEQLRAFGNRKRAKDIVWTKADIVQE